MIRVRQIKVPIREDNKETILLKIARKLNISEKDIIHYEISKKSIDAREKNNLLYIYEIDVEVLKEEIILEKNKSIDVFIKPTEEYHFSHLGQEKLKDRIVIVGSGPAGLFCAYMLAEAGYKPILLERGEKIEDRVQTVEHFFQTNELNIHSNIQFGEGGAGTFSDGKLNTLVKDKAFRGKKVFEIFVENGAPKEIMYLSKPHIGTDILRKVIISIRQKILSFGGEIYYSSMVTNLKIENDKITGVEVNHDRIIPCEVAVLAIGHSARETFQMLKENNILMKPKNFAVGLRIEHPQKMISESQYGKDYELLPPASYKLTYQTKKGRGVYSFCMCPGGYVINASSEKGLLAINGMSNHERDGKCANSAIVVTVSPSDFGESLFSGLEFQRQLEKKAYELGKGKIPVQLYKDYLNKETTTKLGETPLEIQGQYSFADLNPLFSNDINSSIKEAMTSFGHKIKGFDREDAILLGVETRTSSPIMIERNEEGCTNIRGLYPCGEGAGYAGGITTAAMDGIKIAELIAKKYSN